MKTHYLLGLLLVFLWLNNTLSAQVGIGTTTPAASSLLDLTSTKKGLLLPRMTLAQKTAIASPATGLAVFQTDGTSGVYFYDGSGWTNVSSPVGSASGDLSGTYPGPTVAKINGVTLGSTTATSGNLLLGSGTQWVTKAMSGDATITSLGAVTLTNGASTRTNLGLGTANSPTFTGLTLSGLSTSGIVTNTAGGVLGTTNVIPTANLGTGTANSTTVLRGDGTWASMSSAGYRTLINKPSDQAINSTSFIDVTGLSFSVTSGTTYRFQATIAYTAIGTGDGIDFSVNGPAAPTFLAYQIHQPNNTNSEYTGNSTSYDSAPANSSNSIVAGNIAVITGVITPSANGTFSIRCAEEAANKHTIKAASCLEYW